MMKKLVLGLFACVLSIAGVALLQAPVTTNVVAETKAEAVSGMQIIGAGLRLNANGEVDSQTGLRFVTTISDEALEGIFSGLEQGQTVVFGTEITDYDATNPESENAVADISYLSASSVGALDGYRNAEGVVQYHAAITFYDDQFNADVEARVQSKLEGEPYYLVQGTQEYAVQLNRYIEAYRAASYAELLQATSYYQIDGVKYYTQPLVRSMRMIANYCDKLPEEQGRLTEEFYQKNYFVAGTESFRGYLSEDGKITVSGWDASDVTGMAYRAQSVAFDRDTLTVDTAQIGESVGEQVTLYAFDGKNVVTSLRLKYLTSPNVYATESSDWALKTLSDRGQEEEGNGLLYGKTVALSTLKEVSLPFGYDAVWFACDEEMALLARGESSGEEGILTDAVLASNPNAAYLRFYLVKANGAACNTDDLNGIVAHFLVEAETEYLVGTIGSSDGKDKANAGTRVRLNNYLPIEGFGSVSTQYDSVNKQYDYIWFAYEGDSFLGGSGWQTTESYTREEIVAAHPTVTHLRFVIRFVSVSTESLNEELRKSGFTVKAAINLYDYEILDVAYNEYLTLTEDWGLGTLSKTAQAGSTNELLSEEAGANLLYAKAVPLRSMSEITIPQGYSAVWFACDDDALVYAEGRTNGERALAVEPILTQNPDATYLRFYLEKIDGTACTEADLDRLFVKVLLNASLSYSLGSIGSGDGINSGSEKRFRLDEKLSIIPFKSLSVGTGYKLTWFAYEGDAYLGTSGWTTKSYTREEIMAEYPTVTHLRFAICSSSNAVLTLDDVKLSGLNVELELNFNVYPLIEAKLDASLTNLRALEFCLGTLVDDGSVDSSINSSIVLNSYLMLVDFTTVSVGERYQLRWAAYDGEEGYLGSSDWLTAGEAIAAADVLSVYEGANYLRVAIKKNTGVVLNLEKHLVQSQLKIGWKQAYGEYVYDGTPISLTSTPSRTNTVDIEKVGGSMCNQDGAAYGGYLFSINKAGTCRVFDVNNGFSYFGDFSLVQTNGFTIVPHSNSVCFGPYKYEETDEFPLLYCNLYNNKVEDAYISGMLIAYRISRNGTDFTCEPVQVIQIGFTDDTTNWKGGSDRPYGNFVVDTDNQRLYAYVMFNRERNITKFYSFELPQPKTETSTETYGVKTVTLRLEDALESFDLRYFNYVQGVCYYNGMLFVTEGMTGEENPAVISVIDLGQKAIVAEIPLAELGFAIEPECIEVIDENLYFTFNNGYLYRVTFY